jgi:hypothetical protein
MLGLATAHCVTHFRDSPAKKSFAARFFTDEIVHPDCCPESTEVMPAKAKASVPRFGWDGVKEKGERGEGRTYGTETYLLLHFGQTRPSMRFVSQAALMSGKQRMKQA